MAKTIKKKTKPKVSKPRANKYDEKLQIDGSFEDLVKELVIPATIAKKKY